MTYETTRVFKTLHVCFSSHHLLWLSAVYTVYYIETRAPAIAEKPRDSFMSVEMLADVGLWLTQQIASTWEAHFAISPFLGDENAPSASGEPADSATNDRRPTLLVALRAYHSARVPPARSGRHRASSRMNTNVGQWGVWAKRLADRSKNRFFAYPTLLWGPRSGGTP